MSDSMALRFRDLIAPTIKEHRRLIEEGSVWWGWWNKPGERVPRHTFAGYKSDISANGHIEVFLVDSGTETLYRARCVEISESDTEDQIACPHPESTPLYYRESKFKAWFRLESIEPVEPDQIREWSYREVDEFVIDPDAGEFANKRVESIHEMLGRQHRTIYFLQSYQPDDHRTGVVTLSPPRHVPVFSAKPILCESSYIVVLSDLHFGDKHGFPAAPDVPGSDTLVGALIRDLDAQYHGVPPAVVVIAGDLTWTGSTVEFNLATGFIRDLKSAFDMAPTQFVVVPGNHDIRWAEPPEEYDPSAPVTRARSEAEANYRKFLGDLLGTVPNDHLSMGRRYVLGNWIALDVLGLNSCLVEQRHFAGYGLVTLDQIDSAADAMGWRRGGGGTHYRLVVQHHHLLPVTASEDIDRYDLKYSMTLDAGQLVPRYLELSADLVLHGHMHQPFLSSIARRSATDGYSPGRTISIHGAGSAGVARDHTGAIGRNSYSILEPEMARLRVRTRSTGQDAKRFEADWEAVLEANPEGGIRAT